MQGTGAVLARRFSFTSSWQRPEPRPPAGTSTCRSPALGVEHRSDAQALQERAPGDVLGQLLDRDAGLHAPDIDWLSTSLLKGMSREDDRMIF